MALAGVAASELVQWTATRARSAGGPDPAGTGYIVLGYPARRNGSVHPVQKFRVRLARRAHGRTGGTVVFTGGAREGGPSEAAVMARYGESIGMPRAAIVLEERATTTWENVAYSLPLVEGSPAIAFCSDPLHALRARRYALAQRPDLRDRLVSDGGYRPFDGWWIKLPCTAYELGFEARSRMGARR
jgi:uncharacterized SAM-binding protein YcdF (DUF218 family)